MIVCANFNDSLKLLKSGITLRTEFYYFKRSKQKYHGSTIPKFSKDFSKHYIPAPTDSELNELLSAELKEGKNILSLTILKNDTGYTAVYRGYPNEKEVYSCTASTEADAKILLILKLLKYGKIKK